MDAHELDRLTLTDAATHIREGRLSPTELTHAVLGRIEQLDGAVNAFIAVTADRALAEAKDAERRLASGEDIGPLHGVPVSLKDLIDTRGVPTTAGSKVFASRVPQVDATLVRKLRAAGAILVGKANMHECAYGVTSANVHYGPVRNPWNLERVAGGSSGGSAVSVSLRMALGSVGTDTGGSIRIPAALTGVVGLKPTYGSVSGTGIIALSESFDTFGPITPAVEDAAVMFDVMAGPDPEDPRTRATPRFDTAGSLREDIRGLRLGVPRGLAGRTDSDVDQLVRAALARFGELGATLVDVVLEAYESCEGVFRAIAGREVFLAHQAFLDASPELYGPDTRARMEAGRAVTREAYESARHELEGISRRLGRCFENVDLVAWPSVPIPAPPVGASAVSIDGQDEPVLAALTRHTRLFSITGFPALSVPVGLTAGGLPAGLQLGGPRFSEARILRAAFAYERARGPIPGPPQLLQ